MLITSPFCPTMFEFVCMMMSSDVHSALLFAAWLPAAALAGGDARYHFLTQLSNPICVNARGICNIPSIPASYFGIIMPPLGVKDLTMP